MPKRSISNNSLSLIIGVFSFLIFYIFFYLRNGLFNDSIGLYYPDIYRLDPISNDLLLSTRTWPLVLRAHTLDHITANIYSPLAIFIYSLFENFDFVYVRIGCIALTLISIIGIFIFIPKLYNFSINNTYIGLFTISMIPFSYGLRFELERGQTNIIVLFLALIGLGLINKKNTIYLIIGGILLSISIHMKVWPVFLIPCIINNQIDIFQNLRNFIIFTLFNFCLLFVGGIALFKNYIITLFHNIQTLDNAWMANMSLFSFFKQYEMKLMIYKDSQKTVPIHINTILPITVLYFMLFLSALLIIYTLYKYYKYNSKNSINIIYLFSLLALLIPNISYDYKLVVYYIMTALFLSSYKYLYDGEGDLLKEYFNKNKFILKYLFIIEFVLYNTIVLVYPATLFSYVYKLQYGLYFTTNTFILFISTICITGLIYLNNLNDKEA